MKSQLQSAIRSVHLKIFDKGLPDQIAFCLHSLEKKHHDQFRSFVQFFKDRGYDFCNPDEFLGESSRQRILISFDDNYRAWSDSIPLFDELKIRATFYVNTGVFRNRSSEKEIVEFYDRLLFYGERIPLSTDELISLDRAGHTIASHAHSHHILTQIDFDMAKRDIQTGKLELEQLLEKKIRHFAFPFGMRWCFNDKLRAYCRELGFQTIANAIPGLQHTRQSAESLNRSIWNFERSLEYNLQNARVDGALFERLTGRSAVG